jgi:16S rRNA processing protein RimM
VNDPPAFVAVGKITRAHGVKGEVAVLPLSQVAARFEPGSHLYVDEDARRELVVSDARPHRGRMLVTFVGVSDRDQADALRGSYLFVPASESPSLPEGEYWPHQLIGCDVVAEGRGSLGALTEVIHTPANDVWVVRGGDGETLVPALRDVVVVVDLRGRRIVVRQVPGLTAPP